MALTFLAPITAPTPPRAASREGRPSLSLKAMPASRPWYSPTGPQSAERDLLAVPRVQHLGRLEVPLAEVRRGVVEVDRAVLLEVEDHPARRGAVQGEAGDLQLAQRVAEGAAAVGFLDAAGERALAAHARAVGVGEAGAGERAGREDQRDSPGESGSTVAAPRSSRVLAMKIAAGPDDLLALQLAPGRSRDRSGGCRSTCASTHSSPLPRCPESISEAPMNVTGSARGAARADVPRHPTRNRLLGSALAAPDRRPCLSRGAAQVRAEPCRYLKFVPTGPEIVKLRS